MTKHTVSQLMIMAILSSLLLLPALLGLAMAKALLLPCMTMLVAAGCSSFKRADNRELHRVMDGL